MAKGYNRYNLLQKIKDVCEIYRQYEKNETADFIFRNYIYPKHFISRSTFYRFLATPYKKQIEEIEAQRAKEEHIKKMQKRLFDDV
ncbi:MAG: hypothetical protein LBQ74_03795 [Prevotella sp.]|jgi:hypothetical protein|nr:hypothetical protein [Prevotella sp.]